MLGACATAATPASPPVPTEAQALLATETSPTRKSAVENGLRAPVAVAGAPDPGANIRDRMAYYGVPAVSIAVAIDGKLAWADGYGEGIDASTVFQAASMSKAVAATGIVTLAAREGLDIDADITPHLGAFDLAAVNPKGVTVTLRKLLSHTAGATVSGFPGYATGKTIPSNLEVVAGSDHTNTDPVTIDLQAPNAFRYSGGGYQIAQLVAENVADRRFAQIMAELVLEPTGMTSSTFAQPLPASFVQDHAIAKAHNRGPVAVEGGWHIYPEQAAAGLWTTPSDYIRFALAIMAAADGQTEAGLAPQVVEALLTPVSEDYALGFGLPKDDEGRVRLQHGGSNEGYKCLFVAFPDRGAALVVMTNADPGFLLAQEIARGAAATYDWPSEKVREVVPVPLTEAASSRIVGRYSAEEGKDVLFTITEAEGHRIVGATTNGIPLMLLHLGDDQFIDPSDGEEAQFVIDEASVVVDSGGQRFVRMPQP